MWTGGENQLLPVTFGNRPVIRDTIGAMQEQEGFRAVLAGDGGSGLTQAVELKPGLILVDRRGRLRGETVWSA